MFSKKTKKEEVVEEEVIAVSEEPVVRRKSHKEHVFGAFLLGGLIVVVILGLAGAGFGTYSLWKQQSKESQSPSISALPKTEMTSTEEESVAMPQVETDQKEEKSEGTSDALKKAQALDVIVMNGGGAKGVASATAETLKGKGFSKVTIGNTKGDFTGTTVYTKKADQEAGQAIVTALKATYPSIAYKEALTSDPETQTATVTIIFGKE
ncbi:MAG: LytR C-terminal domain-containing protein [Candidatus Moranbacteria bacterium]|nr:LytR C-terminal domain-containing protein [Candidatus Moranbacteria bacterium]